MCFVVPVTTLKRDAAVSWSAPVHHCRDSERLYHWRFRIEQQIRLEQVIISLEVVHNEKRSGQSIDP